MEPNKAHTLTVADLAETIEMIAPRKLQEDWDNSGLLIGFEHSHVDRVLTCLELNQSVLQEADQVGADMIVTHHPLIFGAVREIRAAEPLGRLLMGLIQRNISVYSCHTPFDKVKGGNNDVIAERLGLSSVKNLAGEEVLSAHKMAAEKKEADIGRMGTFKSARRFHQVIEFVSSELQMSLRQLRAVGDLEKPISTVGICTGAGADLLQMAAASGCDLLITGDVKYHEAQTAADLGICLLDAGHYDTEKFFAQTMQGKLQKKLGGAVDIIASTVDLNPFTVL